MISVTDQRAHKTFPDVAYPYGRAVRVTRVYPDIRASDYQGMTVTVLEDEPMMDFPTRELHVYLENRDQLAQLITQLVEALVEWDSET